MSKAVCNVMYAPVRAQKQEQAEMVTQLLFGESMDVLESGKYWSLIKMHFDGYEGWVDSRMIREVSESELAERKTTTVTENFQSVMTKQGRMLLSMGSEVEFPTVASRRSHDLRESIALTAQELLNIPYLWGGRSFFGVDCSGLVHLVYKINGIAMPRDSYQQAEKGLPLTFVEESQPGDLAFFENKEGRIIHVGIMLDNQRIIHASGKVRIDTLDSTGIFNEEINEHTHKLRFVKNIIDA
ncbi:C40 family peptidase [Bergeyella sp. RCAD1439]|uniref:C40 family peptidase n=1 Tax=Bergeyella anatis TaxID=3113737 RepID=UPI002E17C78A|nr:C40 family peptidase [Bergeyella sp. RCAD1439]